MKSAKFWIEKLNMTKHPEGGWFAETYRCGERISSDALPARYSGARSFSTAIYFLHESGDPSKLHRLQSDELWHFYDGAPARIVYIDSGGNLVELILGSDFDAGERLQILIPAGVWFGAETLGEDAFTLAGCTVAPGFEFDDFELGSRDALLEQYPGLKETILRLT